MALSAYNVWRNRSKFPVALEQIFSLLHRKWARQREYRLNKELWAHDGNRTAGRFTHEWRSDAGNWFRCYCNENWGFDKQGLMRKRFASINDLPIFESNPPTGRWVGAPMRIQSSASLGSE